MVRWPLQGRAPRSEIFAIGKYKLDRSIEGLGGLIEFSPAEYAGMGRRFVREKNYNALPVAFLGRPWEVMVQTVHGRIAAIAPYLIIPSRREAETVFTETFRFCDQQLGEPAERPSNFCVGQLAEGTVVLRREAIAAGLRIGLVLTSNAALHFQRL